MNIQIVIPTYNEEKHLPKTLESLVQQTYLPTKIVVVNDNSTDNTQSIINDYTKQYPFVTSVIHNSSENHQPGSKVIKAFNKGFELIDKNYDIVCKFDADLIFPKDYLENIASIFQADTKVGMAGGFCTIEENGNWKIENLTNKDHIRGALKAYRKECFNDMDGLRSAMGWDTVDELLAQYHGWKVITNENLHVKHLKPTGATYTKQAKFKQGEAFYRMRYGWVLTQIAAIKLAQRKNNLQFYFDCMRGYRQAQQKKATFLVNEEEGAFIRAHRWKGVKKKIF